MIVATIGRIVELSPIEDANRLELATVVCGKAGKWTGVVPINQHTIGDLVEVYLPDAIVPQEPRFAFMEKRNWHVSPVRFRGASSECLIVQRTVDADIGADITSLVGASKYEKPIPTNFGDAYGAFPSFVPKTDEPHIQRAPHLAEALHGNPYYITAKVDGTSGTCYRHGDHIGCCSRNWELKESDDSMIWRVARQFNIISALENADDIAFQFEVYGPGIQSNPTGIDNIRLGVFNVFDIKNHTYFGGNVALHICCLEDIPFVRTVDAGQSYAYTQYLLQDMCDKVTYPNGSPIEGLVVRSLKEREIDGDRLSFKYINLNYKG